MDKRHRGIGTAIVAGFGICGGVAAGIVGGGIPSIYAGAYWRTAYYIGGGLGLALLVLRIGVVESGMFKAVRATARRRAATSSRCFTATRVRALPRPDRGRRADLVRRRHPRHVLAIESAASSALAGAAPGDRADDHYAGLAVGDLGSGLISQWLGSRRRTLAIFIAATAVSVIAYFTIGATLADRVLRACAPCSASRIGYWAVFVTVAAEQFGTNLRATVATTTPNFVRGSVVLLDASRSSSCAGSLGIVGERDRRAACSRSASPSSACSRCARRSASTSTTSRTTERARQRGSVMFGMRPFASAPSPLGIHACIDASFRPV